MFFLRLVPPSSYQLEHLGIDVKMLPIISERQTLDINHVDVREHVIIYISVFENSLDVNLVYRGALKLQAPLREVE